MNALRNTIPSPLAGEVTLTPPLSLRERGIVGREKARMRGDDEIRALLDQSPMPHPSPRGSGVCMTVVVRIYSHEVPEKFPFRMNSDLQ